MGRPARRARRSSPAGDSGPDSLGAPTARLVSSPPVLKPGGGRPDCPLESRTAAWINRPLCRIVLLYPERDVAHFFCRTFPVKKRSATKPAPRVLQGTWVIAAVQSGHHAPR